MHRHTSYTTANVCPCEKKKKNPPRLETSEIKKNKEMNKETETCREIGKNRRNKQKSKAE